MALLSEASTQACTPVSLRVTGTSAHWGSVLTEAGFMLHSAGGQLGRTPISGGVGCGLPESLCREVQQPLSSGLKPVLVLNKQEVKLYPS